LENLAFVLFHRRLAQTQDGGSFCIALALSDPEQHRGFTGSQTERFEWSGRGEVRLAWGSLGYFRQPLVVDSFASQVRGDGGEQFLLGHRLGEVMVSAALDAGALVGVLAASRQKDERNHRGGFVFTQRPQYTVAVHAGHHDIAKDQVRLLGAGQLDAAAPVRRGRHLVFRELKEEHDVLAHPRVVFYDEYLLHRILNLKAVVSRTVTAGR
jgi:hypothetical protein